MWLSVLRCTVACVCALAFCAPLGVSSAMAQTASVLVLTPAEVPALKQIAEALARRRGADGRPLTADVRISGPGQIERDMARELRGSFKHYKAVYATTLFLARAVQMEDTQIPIVFEGAADPVQLCLVNSLNAPGRNATGYTNSLPDEDKKLLEVLIDGFPQLKKVVYLVAGSNVHPLSCDPDDIAWNLEPPPCRAGLHAPGDNLTRLIAADEVTRHARTLGVDVSFMVLCDAADIARLPALTRNAPDTGFVVPWQGLFPDHPKLLVDVLAQMRRPTVYGNWLFARHGGMICVEPILDATDDKAPIDMLLQVLDGRSPATLPVQTPRGFKVVVNAVSADRQGLRPSLRLLRRADNVALQ